MGGILNQIIGAGMGMALGNWNDERQLRQQGRLMNQQIIGQKEMTDYQNKAALQMWKDTNYWAQVEEMKKAGLNPALLYGMGGGGGTTAHSASGNVTGGNAPTGGQEVIQGVGMGIQTALMDAQRKNIEADTKLKEATAEKTSGVDTEKTTAETTVIKATNELQKMDITLHEQTLWERINEIVSRSIEQQEKGIMAGMDREIKDKTIQDNIDIIKTTALKVMVEKRLLDAQITLTEEQIKKISAEIWTMVTNAQTAQGHLNVQQAQQQFENNWETIIGKGAVHAIGGLIQVLPFAKFLQGTRPPQIKGFGGGNKKSY